MHGCTPCTYACTQCTPSILGGVPRQNVANHCRSCRHAQINACTVRAFQQCTQCDRKLHNKMSQYSVHYVVHCVVHLCVHAITSTTPNSRALHYTHNAVLIRIINTKGVHSVICARAYALVSTHEHYSTLYSALQCMLVH